MLAFGACGSHSAAPARSDPPQTAFGGVAGRRGWGGQRAGRRTCVPTAGPPHSSRHTPATHRRDEHGTRPLAPRLPLRRHWRSTRRRRLRRKGGRKGGGRGGGGGGAVSRQDCAKGGILQAHAHPHAPAERAYYSRRHSFALARSLRLVARSAGERGGGEAGRGGSHARPSRRCVGGGREKGGGVSSAGGCATGRVTLAADDYSAHLRSSSQAVPHDNPHPDRRRPRRARTCGPRSS